MFKQADILEKADVIRKWHFCCSCNIFRQYFSWFLLPKKCEKTLMPCSIEVILSDLSNAFQIWSMEASYKKSLAWEFETITNAEIVRMNDNNQ